LDAVAAYVCVMRFINLLPLFIIAPVWAQCDMELYGYNPITTEMTIVVKNGQCLTQADSIGEFLLGLTFDPPLAPSPFPCVEGLNWAQLIFPLNFPGFDIGEGADNILQSGDTVNFYLNQIPFFGSGTANCWIAAIEEGAFYDECVVMAIYQINDSETITGESGLTNEPYPDVDPSDNILVWSLGPYCSSPPFPYSPPVYVEDPCNDDDIWVPNAFTPNNDGKNDVFRAITDGDCWLFWDMKVYNRWGDLVWETDTPGAQWLGNNTVGVFAHSVSDGLYYVPDGVYYWKLRGQKRGDVWIEMNGHVNLIR